MAPTQKVLEGVPPLLGSVFRTIAADRTLNAGVVAMKERESEFPSPQAAFLSGIAAFEPSRRYFDDAMDRHFACTGIPEFVDEVIVGGGLHAAIYASVRARMGKPKPLVLEARERAGGVFAASKNPSWWLNSRNRPGRLGYAGEPGSLNYIPGGVVQPSDVSGDEYQTNAEFAWAIRANLAMHANVAVGFEVENIGYRGQYNGSSYFPIYRGRDGAVVYAKRVLIATGLSSPRRLGYKPDRLLTFEEFMGRMDDTFPLRGMDRVAVLGNGDSGKCAVESLLGIGPSRGMSVASLDWPERIDWYGQVLENRFEWCEVNRGRYARIGKFLDTERLNPRREQPTVVQSGYESAVINGIPYDLVINCTGYVIDDGIDINDRNRVTYTIDGRVVARDETGYSNNSVYRIGPSAEIPLTVEERDANPALVNVPENTTAAFRYAGLTAAFAAKLD